MQVLWFFPGDKAVPVGYEYDDCRPSDADPDKPFAHPQELPDLEMKLHGSIRVRAAVLLWSRLVEEEDLDIFLAPLSSKEYHRHLLLRLGALTLFNPLKPANAVQRKYDLDLAIYDQRRLAQVQLTRPVSAPGAVVAVS